MLRLRRFRELAGSYGGDLRHWPAELRADARRLLDTDPEARRLLVEARALDEAITEATRQEEAALWQAGEQQAALARLRAGVAARIAPLPWQPTGQRRFGQRIRSGFGLTAPLLVGRFGLATGTGLAVALGFLIGSLYTAVPARDDVTALLQPAPIHFFTD